jgi:hypothetical protein
MTASNGDDLASALEQCSRRGVRIGVALGAFGLIHAGTVRFLHAAKAQCDSLLVAVLSGSGEKMGGDNPSARPETSARHLLRPDERRRVLAAMKGVEAAGLAEDEGLSLAEWARRVPSARWFVDGAEDAPACGALLEGLGIRAETLHPEDSCTTRGLLVRMGAPK